MRRWWVLGGLVVVLVVPVASAMRTREPPTFTDLSDTNQLSELNFFLAELHALTNGRYTLENLTVNPQDTRKGQKGDLVYATFGGNDHLCVSTSFPIGLNWTCINIGTLSTCPGGADGQVQFNDMGNCGGDPAFLFEKNLNHSALDGDGTATINRTFSHTFFDNPNRTISANTLNVADTFTSSTESAAGFFLASHENTSPAPNGSNFYGLIGAIQVPATVTVADGSFTRDVGLLGYALHSGTTNRTMVGVGGTAEKRGTGNADLFGGYFTTEIDESGAGGTVNLYGLEIGQPSSSVPDGVTVALSYGLYLEYSPFAPLTASGFKDYALYQTGDIADGAQSIFEGRVGIGEGFVTPANGAIRSVKDTYFWGDAQVIILGRTSSGSFDPGKLVIGTSDFTVNANDPVGSIDFWGNDTQQTSAARYARLSVESEATVSSDVAPGRLLFLTAPNNVGSTPVEALRITSDGEVNIGGRVNPSAFFNISPQDRSSVTSERAEFQASGQIVTLTDGTTLANQRQYQFLAPTLNGVAGGSAETISTGATVYIDDQPRGSNITITNAAALWVGSGNIRTPITPSRCVETDSTGNLVAAGGTCTTGGATLASGVWSPTPNDIANLDASSTAAEGQYLQVGTTVSFSVQITVNPTLTATSTQTELDLPVASNFGAVSDASGTCFAPGIAGLGAGIRADAASNELEVLWVASDITAQEMDCVGVYQQI